MVLGGLLGTPYFWVHRDSQKIRSGGCRLWTWMIHPEIDFALLIFLLLFLARDEQLFQLISCQPNHRKSRKTDPLNVYCVCNKTDFTLCPLNIWIFKKNQKSKNSQINIWWWKLASTSKKWDIFWSIGWTSVWQRSSLRYYQRLWFILKESDNTNETKSFCHTNDFMSH